jgi:uncharacterized protein YerC
MSSRRKPLPYVGKKRIYDLITEQTGLSRATVGRVSLRVMTSNR